MIVVDTSAIVAVWESEAEASLVEECLAREVERCMSAASYVEAGTVIAGRRQADPLGALRDLDLWLERFAVEVISVDPDQARIALEARIRFGRGFRSGAKLNYGDCFSYALAKTLNAPLLYIGDDFDKTDVKSALRKKTRKTK